MAARARRSRGDVVELRHRRAANSVSCPGSTGASSTPWLLGSSRAVSGILDHPLQCAIAHKAGDDSSERPHVSIFTYSKSPGLLSMPTLGAEIQEANWPGSVTGVISEA